MLNSNGYGIIFDMDGVIIDTCKLHEESWYKISKIFGFNWDNNVNFKNDIFGTSSVDSAYLLFGKKFTDKSLTEIILKKDEIYEGLLHDNIQNIVMNGFSEFFKSVVESGISVVLATSATVNETDFVLKSLKIYEYFKSIINISLVKKPKPDPEIFYAALKQLGLPRERCIGFEDSLSGIKALQNAGIRCIVVGSTLTIEKLKENNLGFHAYIKDFSEITIKDIFDE